ncbi:MAG TPA: AAA family ATPase, partial [Urbifossiella sp.]|nr:AAA family ATPase [Urbifossiella sp.]
MTQKLPDKVEIPASGDGQPGVHLFDEASVWAVRAALAANRPLLVRGEPGVGKSQLARAAAVWLNRPFLSVVVDVRTESQDLLWSFDAVHRLAQAQICGALKVTNPAEWLGEAKFVHPGKLWWAFDWKDAKDQAEKVQDPIPSCPETWKPGGGCVLLIDEIDKAESDVPNGLLEALGSRSFPVRGRKDPVAVVGEAPLVVI